MIALARVSSGEIVLVVAAAAWLVFDLLRARKRRSAGNRDSAAP